MTSYYKSYKCWIDEDMDRDDAIIVECFDEEQTAAEKFVKEDLYDCGYFSEKGVDESKPIRICVESEDKTVTKFDVYGSYSISFSARKVETKSSDDAGEAGTESGSASSS